VSKSLHISAQGKLLCASESVLGVRSTPGTHGGGQPSPDRGTRPARPAVPGLRALWRGSVRSTRHDNGSYYCHSCGQLRRLDAHPSSSEVSYLQHVGQALRRCLQGLIPALPALRRPWPARPGRHQGLLGRNRGHRSLPEEVAGSPGKPAGTRPRPRARRAGYGVRMTLPTAPLSAAWWAAAMSASGNLCTGSSVSSPATRAALMSAAAWSSAVIGTP
jgi:hypothetical protein